MKDRLASAGIGVDDRPKTHRGVALFFSQLRGNVLQMPEHPFVIDFGLSQTTNMLLGNNQKMHGRLRIGILERQHRFVLVHDLSREFAGDYFAE